MDKFCIEIIFNIITLSLACFILVQSDTSMLTFLYNHYNATKTRSVLQVSFDTWEGRRILNSCLALGQLYFDLRSDSFTAWDLLFALIEYYESNRN